MKEQNWKRKEYETWDEAFRGLSPVIRQQSVRVASYTQALFVWALKKHFGCNTQAGQERMKGQYTELMYKCGLYHQLGKALVPPEYQVWQRDFTDEEQAVYKKYTTDGRVLVAALQEKGARAKDKRKGEWTELPTKNLPWIILRECCEEHMERWDGSGFPSGRLGSDISPVAHIVGLAKELDRIASETKSESPFELAYETLVQGAGQAWSPELIEVLKAAKADCFAVYNKYITYTRTLPRTIPLVERREDRVMGLKYRPMVSDENNTVVFYQAQPWFAGVPDRPGETESIDDLHELFDRTNLVENLSWYFLYEATDTMYRIHNCGLEVEGVLLEMIPEFYRLPSQLQRFTQLFIDQPIRKDQLLLTLPMQILCQGTKTTVGTVERYARNGVCLVVDGYQPHEEWTAERLIEMRISRVCIDPQLYGTAQGAALIHQLKSKGMTVLAKEADTPETLAWLQANGAYACTGALSGVSVTDDELILDRLAAAEGQA